MKTAGWVAFWVLLGGLVAGYFTGYVYISFDRSDALARADSLSGVVDAQAVELASLEQTRLDSANVYFNLRLQHQQDSVQWQEDIRRFQVQFAQARNNAARVATDLTATFNAQQDSMFAAFVAERDASESALIEQLDVERLDHMATRADLGRMEALYARAEAEIAEWQERDRLRQGIEDALREEVRDRGRTMTIVSMGAAALVAYTAYDKFFANR